VPPPSPSPSLPPLAQTNARFRREFTHKLAQSKTNEEAKKQMRLGTSGQGSRRWYARRVNKVVRTQRQEGGAHAETRRWCARRDNKVARTQRQRANARSQSTAEFTGVPEHSRVQRRARAEQGSGVPEHSRDHRRIAGFTDV
jgi:hypothetical protein